LPAGSRSSPLTHCPADPPIGLWRQARRRASIATLAVIALGGLAGRRASPHEAPLRPPPAGVLILAPAVRDSINAIFLRFNAHWNELAETNTLTQMLGTGPPTQREYLGCLVGHASGDTVWVTSWAHARNLKQFQFAVTGSCDSVADMVGTWHTHPYRAAPDGHALKEPGLSPHDLMTFAGGADRAVIAAWDVDSIDAAIRAADRTVLHPATVLVR
jgi:hypothetical protein